MEPAATAEFIAAAKQALLDLVGGGRDYDGVGAAGDADSGDGGAAHVQILHVRPVLLEFPLLSLLTLTGLDWTGRTN